MPWRYKDPKTFPADFSRATLAAIASPEDWIVFASAPNYSSAQALADRFRYWKWCINQRPSANLDLSKLLSCYSLRTKVVRDRASGYVIYLRARGELFPLLLDLNPSLRPIISIISQ